MVYSDAVFHLDINKPTSYMITSVKAIEVNVMTTSQQISYILIEIWLMRPHIEGHSPAGSEEVGYGKKE